MNAIKCPTCAAIGKRLRIDNDKGEKFPEGVEEYLQRDKAGEIRSCPNCKTYFKYISVTDNDIYCPLHYEELIEISSVEAEEALEEERKQKEEYDKAIHTRFGKFLPALSKDEREIFDHLTEKEWAGADLQDLKTHFAESKELLISIKSLVEKELITEAIHKSLYLGKSGFQEVSQEINDWNIHYSINFSYSDFVSKKWKIRKRK